MLDHISLGVADIDRAAAFYTVSAVRLGRVADAHVALSTVAARDRSPEKLIDLLAVQGAEAGGHRGSFLRDFDESMVGLFALIPQAARVVSIPLIAAGGIMDGRAMAAAEMLGAAGSQLGTAFLTCTESGASAGWKRDLAAARDQAVRGRRSRHPHRSMAHPRRTARRRVGSGGRLASPPAPPPLTACARVG